MTLSPSDLAALKSSLAIWEIVEYLATTTVLLGVVGEYIAEFTQFAQKKKLEKKLGKFSTLILIVGIAFELLGLVRTSQLSGRFTASLEEQASQAVSEAESARATAKGFEAQIAEANSRAKAAEAQVALASKRAAVLEVAAEKIRAENLILQSDVLKLREKMADRHLTPGQQRIIASKLRAFAGAKASAYAYSGDSEVIGIAKDIVEALGLPNGAHWIVSAGLEEPNRAIPGILVELRWNADKTAQDAAAALVSALKAERLSVIGPQRVGDIERHTTFSGQVDMSAPISITIGKKP